MNKILPFLFGVVILVNLQNCKETEVNGIIITANKSIVSVGESIVLVVKTNSGMDVTSQASISINDVKISGSQYLATSPGNYSVKATYSGQVSNTISLIFNPSPSAKFVKRILFDFFTGTWCGGCPAVNYHLDELLKKNKLIVPFEIHMNSKYSPPDPLDVRPLVEDYSNAIRLAFLPTVNLDRKVAIVGGKPYDDSVNPLLTEKSDVGIVMASSISGSIVNLTVTVKYASTQTGTKLVVVVVEDNLIADQYNFTEFYGGVQGYLKNFVHNGVLRTLLTKTILGDPIVETTSVGFELSKKFTYTIPSTYQKDKLHFVAFILNSAQEVINVRSAKLAEIQSYEY